MTLSTQLKTCIRDAAQRLGFQLCGVAPALLDEASRERYTEWLRRGYQGEMAYMQRPQRRELAAVLPSVRSVICVGMVYNTELPRSVECGDPGRGWIARYGWGQDYHDVMLEKLGQLLAELHDEVREPFEAKVYVDTGPLLERALAARAGLGWIAKNTCLIDEQAGSWFFLGEILTSLEMEPDAPAWDRCGSCTRCIEACPTGAIVEPYVLDATRCIAYHTIELKGAIPEQFRETMGRHVFGCDICQDVCPWNRRAPASQIPEFQPRPLDVQGASAFNPSLELLASLTEQEFQEVFAKSPVRRARYAGLLRNVAVAMGNSGDQKFQPILEKLAGHENPLVREHATWALGRLNQSRPSAFAHGSTFAHRPERQPKEGRERQSNGDSNEAGK